MKKLILSSVAVFSMATSAFAADIGGSVDLDFAENAAGDWAGTMGVDLSVDATAGAVALGFEATDGAALALDTWTVGTNVQGIGVEMGDDLGMMPGAESGATLAAPAMAEAVKVTVGDAAVAIGLTDWTADVTDISNIQGSYTLGVAGYDLTVVGDRNLDTDNTVLGAEAGGLTVGQAALSGAVTYDVDAEKFAFEGVADVAGITAYANGDQDDMLQNVGGEYVYGLGGAELTAGANYNLDTEDFTPTVGVSFSF